MSIIVVNPLQFPFSTSSFAKRAIVVKQRYVIIATFSKATTSECFAIQVSAFVIESTMLLRIITLQPLSADCLMKSEVQAMALVCYLKLSVISLNRRSLLHPQCFSSQTDQVVALTRYVIADVKNWCSA